MKVLFVTRKYPPSIGGMQRFSYGLFNALPVDKEIVALGRSQKHLLWFLPYALFRTLSLLPGEKEAIVHLGDALLSPLGVIIKALGNCPTVVTVHGLDVTYPNRLYQGVIWPALRRLDRIVAVSRATRVWCLRKGIPAQKIVAIPNGVETSFRFEQFSKSGARKWISKRFDIEVDGRILVFTVGRLIPRKGVGWFVADVLPSLAPATLYLVAGDGPDRRRIGSLISSMGLEGRAHLLGQVDEETLTFLLRGADIFVMPNIPVKRDLEGFGIAALEACAMELPVVAADLEGIRDAVIGGQNGILVAPKDAQGFAQAIEHLAANPQARAALGARAREFVRKEFSWQAVAQRYVQEYKCILESTGRG